MKTMKIYKVLVTGSRAWSDYGAVAKQLAIALGDAKEKGYQKITFMDGACPTGADAMCKEFANKVEHSIPGLIIEHKGFPAKWYEHDANCTHATSGFCVAAGPRRNKQLVDLGPDICLAFIGPCSSPRCKKPGVHPSHGASRCARLAELAGIPVVYTRS
jgi:hypothetical protein